MKNLAKQVVAVLLDSQACECADPKCPACQGHCPRSATVNLRRVDMEDRTGTFFCRTCASDALDSGLFNPDTRAYIRGYGRTPKAITPKPKGIYFSGAGYSGDGMHAVGGSGGLDTGGSAVG